MNAYQIDVNSDLVEGDTIAEIQSEQSNMIIEFDCNMDTSFDVEYVGNGDIPDEIYHPVYDANVEIKKVFFVIEEGLKVEVSVYDMPDEWMTEMCKKMEAQIEYNARQADIK